MEFHILHGISKSQPLKSYKSPQHYLKQFHTIAMASLSLISILSLLLLFVSTPVSLSLPFVVIHGIGNKCTHKHLRNFTEQLRNYSGVEGHCVEVGNGLWDSWFMPIEKQIEIICDKVKNMEELKNGYNLVGLSQGNLIGRGVIELCDGAPPVKNFISLGGPHAGIASVPLCGNSFFCRLADELIKSEVYSDFVQDNLAPSGYIKLPTEIPKYLEKCKFLPKLNNEIPHLRSATNKERFSSLESLVLIMFEHDTVLVPKETSWFGYYPDGAFSPIIPPQQTKLYIEDWIGLKTLDKAGRVKFIRVDGEHLGIADSDMKLHVIPYLQR